MIVFQSEGNFSLLRGQIMLLNHGSQLFPTRESRISDVCIAVSFIVSFLSIILIVRNIKSKNRKCGLTLNSSNLAKSASTVAEIARTNRHAKMMGHFIANLFSYKVQQGIVASQLTTLKRTTKLFVFIASRSLPSSMVRVSTTARFQVV